MTCTAALRLFVVVISEVAPSTGDKGGGGVFGGNATKRLSLPAKKKKYLDFCDEPGHFNGKLKKQQLF